MEHALPYSLSGRRKKGKALKAGRTERRKVAIPLGVECNGEDLEAFQLCAYKKCHILIPHPPKDSSSKTPILWVLF